jgi:hypothetical protein
MKKLLAVAVPAALALLAPAVRAQAPSAGAPLEMRNTGVPGKAEAVRTVKATAEVVGIDKAERTLTLKGKSGQTETFKVSPEVKRLDEVAVGDTLVVEYQEGLALELQSAGDQTVAPEAVAVAGRADASQAPGGAAAVGVRATVTVTAIDPASRMVVFQGPKGQYHQVKAGPNVKLEKLKVGDRLLGTYVQAVAVSIEKPARK